MNLRFWVQSRGCHETSKQAKAWTTSGRGAILFEVVLALVLLAGSATIIFGGLSASVDAVEQLKLHLHAENLAVSIAAELQMGIRSSEFTGPGSFEAPFEDWSWEFQLASFETQPGENSQLKSVEVIIRHKDPELTYRLTQNLWLDIAGRSNPGIAGQSKPLSMNRLTHSDNIMSHMQHEVVQTDSWSPCAMLESWGLSPTRSRASMIMVKSGEAKQAAPFLAREAANGSQQTMAWLPLQQNLNPRFQR